MDADIGTLDTRRAHGTNGDGILDRTAGRRR
jgi:hypothetical protein